jgi:hypothetical protein
MGARGTGEADEVATEPRRASRHYAAVVSAEARRLAQQQRSGAPDSALGDSTTQHPPAS